MKLLLAAGIALTAISAPLQPPAARPSPGTAWAPITERNPATSERSYSVTIVVNGRPMAAAIDSGSVGLRVLGFVGTAFSASEASYRFATGLVVEGPIGAVSARIAAVAGAADAQLVRTISCAAEKPFCPAALMEPQHFRFFGLGVPDKGYEAILGTGLGSGPPRNPLISLGVNRWVIELPRAGDPAGRLILSPAPASLSGFSWLPIAGRTGLLPDSRHDAVSGCLTVSGTAPLCGLIILDTGAAGIRVRMSSHRPIPAVPGTPAVLSFGPPGRLPCAVEHLVVGMPGHASHLSVEADPSISTPLIFAGVSPYLAFDIAYDASARAIGLRPRVPVNAAPKGDEPSHCPIE